jgi:hypothetical protein
MFSRVAMFQSRTVWSSLPERRKRPSGEIVTAQTSLV